jgi:hypothetical protein
LLKGNFGYTRREPLGVIGAIGAWIYPIQGSVWKSTPALACGNSIIFKPAEDTPSTALKLAEMQGIFISQLFHKNNLFMKATWKLAYLLAALTLSWAQHKRDNYIANTRILQKPLNWFLIKLQVKNSSFL